MGRLWLTNHFCYLNIFVRILCAKIKKTIIFVWYCVLAYCGLVSHMYKGAWHKRPSFFCFFFSHQIYEFSDVLNLFSDFTTATLIALYSVLDLEKNWKEDSVDVGWTSVPHKIQYITLLQCELRSAKPQHHLQSPIIPKNH